MKTLIYVPVKVEEELPTIEDWYFVISKHEGSAIPANYDIWNWTKGSDEYWINTFDYWLKPVEISENGIVDAFQEYSSQNKTRWI